MAVREAELGRQQRQLRARNRFSAQAGRRRSLTRARRRLHQFCEFSLPEFGESSGPVAEGVGAAGNQKHAPVLDTLDFSIKNAQLRWIALVVCRIDGEHSGLDSIESWRWVVVAGGFPLVQVIVRIACEGARQALFEERIGFFTL